MTLFNKLKNAKSTSLNKVGTGSFDMDAIKSAKNQVGQRDENRKDNYAELYNQALALVDKFLQNPERNTLYLKKATFKLVEALSLVKNKPEPYLLLAYIFYMMGDVKGAIKYLKACSDINPNLSGLSDIKKLISGEKSEINSGKDSFSTSPLQSENVNKSISNLQKSGPPLSIRRITPIQKK